MRTFELKLTEQMAQIVLNALADAPFKVSASVIEEIMKQVKEQSKPVAEAPKVEESKE